MTYLLFIGSKYYPSGGWDDFLGCFQTHEDAQAEMRARGEDEDCWWHIVNADTHCIVERGK